MKYYVKYSIIKEVTSNLDIAIWQGGFTMRRTLASIGIFLIAFAASCITFYFLRDGAVGMEQYIVALILGVVAVLRDLKIIGRKKALIK